MHIKVDKNETRPSISVAENTLILPTGSSEVAPDIPPVQSANTLFRFFTKFKYLKGALQKQALIPRYYGEDVNYLDIGYNQISYPMVCFCDINMHRLGEHTNTYGKYGIAFTKAWGMKAGIQPLQYVNPNSPLCKDFSLAFKEAIERNKICSENESTKGEDYILTQMMFLKPIIGDMPRNGKWEHRNFTDEREWRYIPEMKKIDLPPVVPPDYSSSLYMLNATLEEQNCEECWLKFEYSDLKYIIIPSKDDFEALCDVLDQNIADLSLRKRLTSKIMIWEDVKEDF